MLLLSCSAGDGDGEEDDGGGDGGGGSTSDFFTIETTTDDNGIAEAEFEVPSGTTKFAVTAEVSDLSNVRFEELSDDEGTDFLTPSGESISFSNEFFTGVNTVSVPSRDFDPLVDSSRSFLARARVSNRSGSRVNLTVNARADANLGGGTLLVNVFYVGEVGQSNEAKAAVAGGLEAFRIIYSGEAGITLRVVERDVSGPSVLPNPFDGADFYRSASQSADFPAVNIFICGDLAGSEGEILGISGGIPGPPIPSLRSGVALSIITGAGPDGIYDTGELRLLGETMAHEVGHFMGLFHPVDFAGTSVSGVDPLSDTPTCSQSSVCEQNESLATNNLYPVPVIVGDQFVAQNQLTAQQRGVLNRYIAVD